MTVEFSDGQKQLQEQARRFSNENIKPASMQYLDSDDWPWEIYERAAEEGLIGLWIDEKYGGQGASLIEQCIVDEEFARGDSNVGLALHSSVAGCYVVSQFGTHEQKKRWIGPATRGKCTTSIGMTEPDTGSALKEISTTAVRDGDEYIINGEKRWVGNGSKSDWIATLCRTDPDIDAGHQGLSLIVVPSDTDGFSATSIDKLGLRGNDHAQMEYNNVQVPTENLLGSEEGKGFYQVLKWLNQGHGRISVAAIAVGQAQGAFDRTVEYAKEREQGGQLIGDHQGIRWKLADMKMKIEVARSQVHHAARIVRATENGKDTDDSTIEQSSIAKLYATEMAIEVANDAVQIFGGNGFAKEYEVEHIYRDVKAGTLYEGTSEILRNTIGKTLFDEL